MLGLYDQINDIVTVLRKHYSARPRVGIILGSGLGPLAEQIDATARIEYRDLPHLPVSTAVGHQGRFVCGSLAGIEVIAMQGRLHAYEGHSHARLTLPVRAMIALGIDTLIVSNAAGGLNPGYQVGDLMALDDHINLMNDNPLVGVNDERLGPRWPDMSRPYCPRLIELACAQARAANLVLHRGVYVAVRGPNYESRAEQRFLRAIGGDCVGMSTVPEVIVAVHAGIRVLGLSVVTNVCRPDAPTGAEAHAVVAVAQEASGRVAKVVTKVLSQLTLV